MAGSKLMTGALRFLEFSPGVRRRQRRKRGSWWYVGACVNGLTLAETRLDGRLRSRSAYSQYAIAHTPALHVKCAHPEPPLVQSSQRAGSAPVQSLGTAHSAASTGGGGVASAEPEPPSSTGHAMLLACAIVPFSQKHPPQASLLQVHDVPFAWLTPLSTHGAGPASAGGGAASATHPTSVLAIWPFSHVQVLQPSLQVHEVPSAWLTPSSTHGVGLVPASPCGGKGMACVKQSMTLASAGSLRQQSARSAASPVGTCHPLGHALQDGGEGSGHAGAALQVQLFAPVVCAGQLQTGSEQSGFVTV
jgi:hypothetical protein